MTRRRALYLCLAAVLLLAGCTTSPSLPEEAAVTPVTPSPTATVPAIPPTSPPTPLPATAAGTVAAPTQTAPAEAAFTPLPTDTPPPPTATPWPVPEEVVLDAPGASLPPGFSIKKFASMFRPTGLAFDPAGNLYATSQDGSVHIFQDDDGDGYSDHDTQFIWGFDTPLGVAIRPETGDVYISSKGKISIARDTDGDLVSDEAFNFVKDLPFGRHQNDNLKFGPDGWLYMGVGSTCDACYEEDYRSATIMRFNPDTADWEVFAEGLRNPYDLAFDPVSGALFATDNGRDDLGEDEPYEELNHIVAGGDYGFPDCWDDGQGPDCAGTIYAVAFFQPRSSADSLLFYDARSFPPAYWNDAFVVIFGSFQVPGVQTGIRQVKLTPDGDTFRGESSWFASWQGMPLGLALGPDGWLYVGDYINDSIYRISYGP